MHRLARTDVTLFRRRASWQRWDYFSFLQRCYSLEEISALLVRAGFREVRCLDAARDLGANGAFSEGRAVICAVRP